MRFYRIRRKDGKGYWNGDGWVAVAGMIFETLEEAKEEANGLKDVVVVRSTVGRHKEGEKNHERLSKALHEVGWGSGCRGFAVGDGAGTVADSSHS